MIFLDKICETREILDIIRFILKILNIICFIIPMILIVMTSIDIGKNIVSKEDAMKKNISLALKRVLATVIIFLLPTIITTTMNIIGSIGVEFATCITNAKDENIEKFKKKSSTIESGSKDVDLSGGSSGVTGKNSKNDTSNTEIVDYKLEKTLIVIPHYHGKKINKQKIIIYKKKGKKYKNSKFNFEINKPIATIDKNGVIDAQFGGSATITVSPKTNPSNIQKITLTILHGTYTKVTTNKKLKVRNLETGEKEILPKGTEGVYNGIGMLLKSPSKQMIYYHGDTLKIGKNYYKVSYNNVTPQKYKISDAYSKEVVEEFVNYNEYTSDTKYLFWINLGTEENYVLKKKKKKWVLLKMFDIATGDIIGINPGANLGHCNGSQSGGALATGIGACDSIRSTKMASFKLSTTWAGYWKYGGAYTIFSNLEEGSGGFGAWHEFEYPDHKIPRYPGSHGCVRHNAEDLIWVRDHISEVGGSRIVRY